MALANIFSRLALMKRPRRTGRCRAVTGRGSHGNFFAVAEKLEPRIALTVNVFTHNAGGDSPGYAAFILDESGDDLYLRQTLQTIGAGSEPVSFLELADNPGFFSSFDVAFDTNSVVDGNNYQDIFVSQGVQNTWTQSVGSGRSTTLPDANNVAPVGGFAGLEADETFHVLPGTLGGSPNFFSSNFVITLDNGAVDGSTFATQNLLDEQDGLINGEWPLVFSNNQTSITLPFSGAGDDDMGVTGTVNLYTGQISLNYTGDGTTLNPQTTFFVNYASPVVADDPSTVTLATGLTVDAGFAVDLPSPDSTITVASPINSPSRGTADQGLLDLRATNVLVNAPVVADGGTRVLESRFHNSPSVETNVVGDVYASNIVPISDAASVQVGARVFVDSGNDAPGFEWFPADTNVVAINGNELTLSHVVSTLSGDPLDIYNPSSVASASVTLAAGEELVESATIFLDGPGPFDIQPGAVVQPQGTIETDTYIPLNTFVAAVNTVTGRVDLTRPVSLPVGTTTIDFYNNGYDDTKVERFEATTVIESPSFNFHIADDNSSDIRDRGRLYVAGSSGLRGVGGGTANLLTANVAASDIVFEGDVAAATQSYLFQTTITEAPYTFTTKNSSGVSTGSLSGTTLDVTLANATPPEAQNAVIQVVDLDTAVTSMRISAEDTAAMNPPFPADGPDDHDPIPEGPFPFAITIRESDDLSIDANLASGGPVDVTVGGDLALTSTIQSSQDLSFTAGGAITGTAWLTTVDGQISLEATDVSIDGLVQVLARPFDGITTDITVTATDGSIALGQGVRAVNKILIDQRSAASPATPGGVQSNGLLAAYDVQVFADGDVDIDTAAPFVDVSVASVVNGQANNARNVTVVSGRPGEFSISTAGGSASVTARGVDVNSDTPSVADDVAALSLTLRETGVLFASAPEGSIDVTAVSSDTLVMGVAADLLAGTAANMQAAGSVKVRTTQAPVTVLDAAIAGQGSLQVRAVTTTADLTAVSYAQNTPGITPSTITANTNGSINGAALAAFGGLDAATNPLRFRDLVLLNQQANAEENGVYQIVSLGNASEPWQLRRYALAETTAELPVGRRMYVTDGDDRGNTYRVSGYANVLNTTPLRVSPGLARSADEIAVRFATEAILDGTFNAGAGTITGALGSGVRLRVNETPVNAGDLILVQFGAEPGGAGTNTTPSSVANGVYQVTTAEGAWVLTRYNNPEPPADPEGIVEEATVLVNEGFFRTSRTGQTFQVAYDGLGLVGLTIADDTANVVSELGSYDPRDTTTLVVSTAGGTNQSAGSLGKMLTLAQDNAALDLAGQEVLQALRFGNVLGSITGVTGTIGLRQELPNIERPLVIDATQRYNLSPGATSQTLVIDGSRITASSESTFVTRADEVNGLVLLAGASADTTSNPFRPLESTVSALRFGGFEQGAAVVVDGASNVLLEDLTVGQNSNSDAQAVRYGVRVTGDSGKLGPVTVLDGTFTSATIPTNPQLPATSPAVTPQLDGAGVLIDGLSQNTQVVGSTVGSQTAGNVVGVLVRSSNSDTSLNQVGARPIDRFTAKTTLNLFTLALPDAVDMNDVYLGQTVSGTEIASGTTIIAIDRATSVVTLSDAAIGSNSSAIITLGTPQRTTVGKNFWGIRLESGATRVVNTDVENNILDGILIGDGEGAAVFAAIGASTTADSSSNAIYSNGRNGIRFAKQITKSTGPAEIQIQGNYVGRTVTSTTFVGNAQGSYYWEGYPSKGDAAFASLGYDPETQTPVPPPYITADPLFDSLITPASAGGTVDANGNVNADFVSGNGGGGPVPPGPPPPNDGNT